EAPLGPGQGEENAGDRGDDEGEAKFFALAGNADHEAAQEARADELTDELLFDATGPPEESHEGGDGQEQKPQVLGLGEVGVHGSFLQTVWPSAISSSRMASPATVTWPNNSS